MEGEEQYLEYPLQTMHMFLHEATGATVSRALSELVLAILYCIQISVPNSKKTPERRGRGLFRVSYEKGYRTPLDASQ